MPAGLSIRRSRSLLQIFRSAGEGIDARQIVGRVRSTAAPRLRSERSVLRLLDGDWSESEEFVSRPELPQEGVEFANCRRHWIDGVPWEETDVYRVAMDVVAPSTSDPQAKREKIRAKYARLDVVFEEVRRHGFSRRSEHRVSMSLSRDGALLAGPNGRHRVAMAVILERPLPVTWLVLHPEGLDSVRLLH